jgi:hypothetical protein
MNSQLQKINVCLIRNIQPVILLINLSDTMKLALAGILVMSLVLAMVFTQQEVYATSQQKILNIAVYVNNGPAAIGATCGFFTNLNPLPSITVTTDHNGKASVILPSSTTTVYVACIVDANSGSATVQLHNTITNLKLFLQ